MDKPMSGKVRRAEARARPEPELDWVVAEAKVVESHSRPKRAAFNTSKPSQRISKKTLDAIADKAGVKLEYNRSWVREIGEEGWTRYYRMYGRIHSRLRRASK